MKPGDRSRSKLSLTSERRWSKRSLLVPSQKSLQNIRETVHCSCERLREELFGFCDDFVRSEEYRDYVRFRSAVARIDKGTQCDGQIEEPKEVKIFDPAALSKKALRVFYFESQLEKYTRSLKNAEVVQKQLHAINIIRSKIKQAKDLFFCHKEERDRIRREKETRYVEKYIRTHNINVSLLLNKEKLSKFILRKKRDMAVKTKEVPTNILMKLTKEYEKPKLKKKVKKIVLLPEKIVVEETPPAELLQKLDEFKVKEEPREEVPTNPEDEEEIRKMADEIASIMELKHGLDLKSKSKLIADLIRSFLLFEDYMERIDLLAKSRESIAYPRDDALICVPERIVYRGYQKGKVYTKRVRLINRTASAIKVRFVRFRFEDEYTNLCFEIRPDDLQVLYPGLPLKVSVSFRPETSKGVIRGHATFLTSRDARYYERHLAIECDPFVSEITIAPLSISFGSVPMWKVQNPEVSLTKHIDIKSVREGRYKVVIKKIHPPEDATTDVSYFHIFKRHQCSLADVGELSPSMVMSPARNAGSASDVTSDTQLIGRDEYDVYRIVNDVVDDVIRCNFRLDPTFVDVDGSAERTVAASFVNADYPGYYAEKYGVEIYGADGDLVGFRELMLTAEVEDFFIRVTPEVIDFGMCRFDTAYQVQFLVKNNSSQTQSVAFQVPLSLRDYVSTNLKQMHLNAEEERSVCLRLLLRAGFLEEYHPCYDKDTSILSFPVKVKMLKKCYQDVPPLKVYVYGIISDVHGISCEPTGLDHVSLNDGKITIDFGTCRINESVYTDIVVRNHSFTPRYYCFRNVPKYVTIWPGYGIGKVMAFEEVCLRVYINPQIEDANVDFTLFMTSLVHMGRYRKKQDTLRLLRLLRSALRHLKSSREDVIDDMVELRCKLKRCVCASAYPNSAQVYRASVNSTSITHRELSMGQILREKFLALKFRGAFVRPLYEFSHTDVSFPETPGTSFSTATVTLRPLQRVPQELKATYKIVGSTEEIGISPTDGVLVGGQSVELTLVATPKIKDQIVMAYAFELKRQEMVRLKIAEEEERRTKAIEDNKKKSKRQSVGTVRRNKNSQVTFADPTLSNQNGANVVTVDAKDIHTSYLDFYPAELALWRNVKPYLLNVDFACKVSYEPGRRDADVIRLRTRCRVVAPQFVHDLRTQRVDFGGVAIGATKRRIVTVQNITYDDLAIRTSVARPGGAFFCRYFDAATLPPEHFLRIPITFRPETEREYLEHFEITGGDTQCRLILTGNAVAPDITFHPETTVFRLEVGPSGTLDIPLEITNNSAIQVDITLEKVCEADGTIERAESDPSKVVLKKRAKSNLALRHTEDLFDDEIRLIESDLSPSEESCFECASRLSVDPRAKSTVKIRFESPKKSSSKVSLVRRSRDLETDVRYETRHLVKYNVNLGRSTFLREIIVFLTLKKKPILVSATAMPHVKRPSVIN